MKKLNVEFIDLAEKRLEKKRKNANLKYTLGLYMLKYIPIILGYFVFNFWIFLAFSVAWWFVITIFCDHRHIVLFSPSIRIWFGVPGSGKTSIAAWITKKSNQLGYKVLSNVEIDNAYILEDTDLGKYDMSFDGDGCHVIIDEATLSGLDNRGFKEFYKSDKPRYFSLHRHMNNRVDVFSQGYDIDLRVKDRAGQNGLFHLTRLPFKGYVMYRRISKIFFIKDDDKQFVDGYKYNGLPRICRVKSVWNSFDTLDMSLCPTAQKDWKKWNEGEYNEF